MSPSCRDSGATKGLLYSGAQDCLVTRGINGVEPLSPVVAAIYRKASGSSSGAAMLTECESACTVRAWKSEVRESGKSLE